MASLRWTWDVKSRRYRDGDTGRWIGHGAIADLRDEYAAIQREWADQAAGQLVARNWTVSRWETEVRARLKRIYVTEYLLGRGGQNVMTQADYGRIGSMLRDQYEFLRQFALDINDGKLSEAQIAARTQLYHSSAAHAFERGKAVSYSTTLALPVYPSDGRTPCKTNCRCRWRITETKTRWRAYWTKSARESCSGCEERARLYSPYTQLKA